MGINDTPVANRYTIGLYGKRNAGKSSLINAITDQEIALTSSIAGTTTDPVQKTMEILPIGPVMLIDTAGLDDEGELGEMRIRKSYEALRKCNLAILVCDATLGMDAYGELEQNFLQELRKRKIACVIALNKVDGIDNIEAIKEHIARTAGIPAVATDAASKTGIEELKASIIANSGAGTGEISLTDGFIDSGEIAVLVTPIDSAAPKGRMILPQQQVMRDILDKGSIPVLCREFELPQTLAALKEPPVCVITDSQAFKVVSKDVPEDIPLTSFSILFARQKGDLIKQLDGVRALKDIKAGDKILIAEACSHHRQEDDIGTVKIPRLIRQIEPGVEFEWSHGGSFPEDLSSYKLVIHCGACMINRREMLYRINYCNENGVPVTNYGLVLAYVNGILERAIAPLGIEL